MISLSDRLAALRADLARAGLHGFLVPRADEHLGEYVPLSAERLAWLTGFTGSAGLAVVLPDRAAVFTDGRYVLQAAAQTDAELWERRHITDDPPPAWIAAHVPAGVRIGYDPWLISPEGVARYREAGLTLEPVEPNPIDRIWTDRPAPPADPAHLHPADFAGEDSADKRAAIAKTLTDSQQDALVVTDPAALAWLFNLRGTDLPFTPVPLGFAILHADAAAEIFMPPAKLDEAVRAALGNAVSVADRDALPGALDRLTGKRVRLDPSATPEWFFRRLRSAGAQIATAADPIVAAKARKNPVEQQGIRDAHLRDGVAVCRFLHWLAGNGRTGNETELSAASHLLGLREGLPSFRGESFPAISAAGEHGAVIHYRVTLDSNRPIRANEVYLIDSGAQFPDGTTDITRTIWTGPDPAPKQLRERATRVLKGHIAIATLIFPAATTGAHLDAFARRALWQNGLDYDHGTGHGVGSYLSVHEGPVSLSRLARPIPIQEGMLLSNEPGFYLPGHYGIRLENLVLVQPADFPDPPKPFFRFETLTLAPFDRALIDGGLLDPAEREWLNAYHARVLDQIGPALPTDVRDWLTRACAPID